MKTINDQLREVLQGGWTVFARKARTALRFWNKVALYLAHALWTIPVLIGIRILRPFILIKVGELFYQRIGHFAADVGRHTAESLGDRSQRRLNLWYLPGDHECSNSYWARITRRWLRVHSLVRYLVFWNRFIPFASEHFLSSGSANGSRDVNGILERGRLHLPATLGETAEARRWMNQFGWKEGEPFVCLLVRDSKYLNKKFPENDWNYHSYRDSDIQTYVRGIDYLTSQGVYVFRMGKDMANITPYSHPKFIDYAFREDKSDLIDVWLFAHCSLCITTGSGPDMISDVFRRPILALNFLPLHGLWSWSKAIHYPKTLRWIDSKRHLSLTSYLDADYLKIDDYERAGIEISDLGEEQIHEAIIEAWSIVFNGSETIKEYDSFAAKSLQLLKNHHKFSKFHYFLHPELRFSSRFLATLESETGII